MFSSRGTAEVAGSGGGFESRYPDILYEYIQLENEI